MNAHPGGGGTRRRADPGQRRGSAFTLIELLVVVAIIALLIAILLPSLSKARGQARSTLCATRISQLAKAILVYADDFNETPPFMGRGWEDCDDTSRLNSEVWPEGSGLTLRDWAMLEDWLMPNMPDYWMSAQEDWPDYAKVRNGRLFPYTRFENLYRCPEFERVSSAEKSQDVFNYTRSILGRKWFHRADPEGSAPSPYITSAESENWCGQAGPILKISQVHAPSQLQMFLDEQWNRHCAAPIYEFQQSGGGIIGSIIREQWFSADCIFGIWGDEIGRYHGPVGWASVVPESVREDVPDVKSGNIACYDAHVALERDPLPDRDVELGNLEWGINRLLDWLRGHIYAQRGINVPQDGFVL